MRLAPYTRIIRTFNDVENDVFTVFNTQINKEILLDRYSYEFLKKNTNDQGLINIPWYLKTKSKKFVQDLISNGFILDDKTINSEPLFIDICENNILPLTYLNLELTNICNLNCIHCYGKYGKPKKSDYLTYDMYMKLKSDFDYLNLKGIALTGGECTLNKDFESIALDILHSGYELTILTNGYNTEIIKNLVNKTQKFHYTIKISLDGDSKTHNFIRGNKLSYDNVIELLEYLKNYKNITVYISSILMKKNLENYIEFDKFINSTYPDYIHTTDLIFPGGNASCNDESFSLKELEEIKLSYPNLFKKRGNIHRKNKLRCSGGFSQCTIESNGKVKICNSACDDRFRFKYDIINKSLKEVWENCGDNINYFRNERVKSNDICTNCKNLKTCQTTNCRVLAFYYTGSHLSTSPITCLIEKE